MDELQESMGRAIAVAHAALDKAESAPDTNPRSLAIARTQFATAFLWLDNAIGGEAVFRG